MSGTEDKGRTEYCASPHFDSHEPLTRDKDTIGDWNRDKKSDSRIG